MKWGALGAFALLFHGRQHGAGPNAHRVRQPEQHVQTGILPAAFQHADERWADAHPFAELDLRQSRLPPEFFQNVGKLIRYYIWFFH